MIHKGNRAPAKIFYPKLRYGRIPAGETRSNEVAKQQNKSKGHVQFNTDLKSKSTKPVPPLEFPQGN